MVGLEAFSKNHAIRQGLALHRLTHDGRVRDLLTTDYPSTLQRYRDWPHAIRNVARIAASGEVRAHIIRVDGVARGIGTIIFNQGIVHPDSTLVRGNNIDYWLGPALNGGVHDAVVHQLLDHAEKLNDDDNFAVIGLASQSSGFRRVMRPVGEPAQIASQVPGDPFDIANGGQLSQLYVSRFPKR